MISTHQLAQLGHNVYREMQKLLDGEYVRSWDLLPEEERQRLVDNTVLYANNLGVPPAEGAEQKDYVHCAVVNALTPKP